MHKRIIIFFPIFLFVACSINKKEKILILLESKIEKSVGASDHPYSKGWYVAGRDVEKEVKDYEQLRATYLERVNENILWYVMQYNGDVLHFINNVEKEEKIEKKLGQRNVWDLSRVDSLFRANKFWGGKSYNNYRSIADKFDFYFVIDSLDDSYVLKPVVVDTVMRYVF